MGQIYVKASRRARAHSRTVKITTLYNKANKKAESLAYNNWKSYDPRRARSLSRVLKARNKYQRLYIGL